MLIINFNLTLTKIIKRFKIPVINVFVFLQKNKYTLNYVYAGMSIRI